jgi:hypothetical protein
LKNVWRETKKIVQIKWNSFFFFFFFSSSPQEAQKEKEREDDLVDEDDFLFVWTTLSFKIY